MTIQDKTTVIVVDDTEESREMILRMLQFDSSLEVIGGARSGLEAIDLAQRIKPDVIVMDHTMPGMDGLETLRHMKQKAPKLPVLLLTGHACMGVAVEGLDLGAYDYMLKPVAISELIIKMEEAVRSAV